MSNLKFRRKGFYNSIKAGLIFVDSSYELKAATILDEDANVLFYENHITFHNDAGKKRITDFLITKRIGGKQLIEVKPKKRLLEFAEQIGDNQQYASSHGYDFAVWTENDLGFATDDECRNWADKKLTEMTGLDYAAIRKQRNSEKAMKHYRKSIATDTITVHCEYCQADHTALRLTYDKNIARNGRYICEKEGGYIAGSKPKKKKVNPYAEQGMKQCLKCQRILPFACFGFDKSRSDGYADKCKECRNKK